MGQLIVLPEVTKHLNAAQSHFKKLTVAQPVKNVLNFMQPEDSLPPFPILGQMNPVHNLSSSRSVHFNIIPIYN
jgi:hypothetical protein